MTNYLYERGKDFNEVKITRACGFYNTFVYLHTSTVYINTIMCYSFQLNTEQIKKKKKTMNKPYRKIDKMSNRVLYFGDKMSIIIHARI